jgi:orotidine-5'-phosphate decarboxylase
VDRITLVEQIKAKKSFLCVGLDTEKPRIPKHLQNESDPVFSFNKAIIDATAEYVIAYKPNTAFYEVNGSSGWLSLEKTIAYLNTFYPDIFIIADAKRGDIGNTSTNYAKAFFETMDVDAVTVAPYMGHDSVQPFLAFNGKWVVLLALTSNSGSSDFQYVVDKQGETLYEKVIQRAISWAKDDQMMFVVGATHPEELAKIRSLVPDYFLLVPGVGAQGGDLTAVSKAGLNSQCGLIVNSSRAIIYASDGADFAEKAAYESHKIQQQMLLELTAAGII